MVSTGLKTMRKRAAATEAKAVCMYFGSVRMTQGKDACIGGCVAKESNGSLHECGGEALVVPGETPVSVEGIYGLWL